MRSHSRFALIGVLLGLGAPLGSLLLRVLLQPHAGVLTTLTREWQTADFYYVYMTIGTIAAFGLFAYILGRLNDSLRDLSVTDGLTKLYNHRYLQEQLTHEMERSDRYASPVTCLMLDIDDFKKINDLYGHPFGDVVLIETAEILHATMRRTDIAGRYGGEEFLIIMPETDADAAFPIAQRIVSSVREHSFVFKGILSMRLTISIGLATYPLPESGVRSKDSLLSATDQALYKAKRAGKNQVVVWRV